MNEKTDTKSREGLIKFYYQWEKSGKINFETYVNLKIKSLNMAHYL